MHIRFYHRDDLTAEFDLNAETCEITNYHVYADDPLDTPFGLGVTNPTYELFSEFCQSRVFPPERYNARDLLDYWGLDYYDPVALATITHGAKRDDWLWMKFDDDAEDFNFGSTRKLLTGGSM